MKEKRVLLRTKHLSYPSISEERSLIKSIPSIRNFGFDPPAEPEIIRLMNGTPFKEVHLDSQLYYWDTCLLNRLGKLRFAFINLSAIYKRGVPDRFSNLNERQVANSFLFNYHLEAYLFLYFSSVETINQILNIQYELKLKEDAVSIGKILKRIEEINPTICSIMEAFNKEIKPLRDFRNNLTHRFSINYPDYRPSLEETEKRQTYNRGTGKFIKPSQFMSSCKHSLIQLNDLLNQLRSLLLESNS